MCGLYRQRATLTQGRRRRTRSSLARSGPADVGQGEHAELPARLQMTERDQPAKDPAPLGLAQVFPDAERRELIVLVAHGFLRPLAAEKINVVVEPVGGGAGRCVPDPDH